MKVNPILFLPLQKKFRQRFERDGFAFENFQRAKRFVRQLRRNLSRFFQADNRRISGFLNRDIFARRFAKLLAGLRHVENVVNHLKREADVIAEVGERGELRGRAVGAHAAEAHGAAQQRGGLALVDEFQFGDGKFFVLAFQIRHLAADELQRAGRFGDFQNNFIVRIARKFFALRGDLERLRQQRVAREHGDAFAKNFVVREFATTIIVIIHRGQIVVDKRIGVDALDGARERHGVRIVATARFRRREEHRRTHPLAAGEKRVAHGYVDCGGLRFFGRQKFVERGIDGFGARGEKVVQVER